MPLVNPSSAVPLNFQPSVLINANSTAVTFSASTLGAASSLVGWFYFIGINLSNYSPIWYAGSSPDSQVYYGDGGHASKLTVIKAGTEILISTANLPAINTGWHFVAITDNGVALKAYVDGVDVGNSVGSYTTMDTMTITKLNQGINSNNYVGYISECAIFSRALSLAEVTTLYASGDGVYGNVANAPFNSGLVAGWHLNEGGSATVLDFSGNGHTATLNAGASMWAPLQNIITPP